MTLHLRATNELYAGADEYAALPGTLTHLRDGGTIMSRALRHLERHEIEATEVELPVEPTRSGAR